MDLGLDCVHCPLALALYAVGAAVAGVRFLSNCRLGRDQVGNNSSI